jgi:hypothetical protein
MKVISVADFKIIKAAASDLVELGITPFSEPKKQWMQKVAKFYRRNCNFQGITSVNWARLVK